MNKLSVNAIFFICTGGIKMKFMLITKKDISLIFFMLLWIFSIVFVIYGSLSSRASAEIRRVPVYSVETSEKQVSLTFNCAWTDEGLGTLLKILRDEDVKCTFFFVGDFASEYPEAVRLIHNAGHEIGNHSMHHNDPVKQEFSEIVSDIEACNELLFSVTGVKPSLYRAPSGSYDNKTVEAAESLGMTAVQWDTDSIDWKDRSSEKIMSRVTEKVTNGSIVLFHLGKENTLEALPGIIKYLKGEGFSLVKTGEMLLTGEVYTDNSGRQHRIK